MDATPRGSKSVSRPDLQMQVRFDYGYLPAPIRIIFLPSAFQPGHNSICSCQRGFILVAGNIWQKAVISEFDLLGGPYITEKPADLLAAVLIVIQNLLQGISTLPGEAALIVDQAARNGIVDPQTAGSPGQIGKYGKGHQFPYSEAAGLVRLLGDGSSGAELGGLSDLLTGIWPPG